MSVRYGLYFSYPIYLLIVIAGVLSKSPYILAIAATIAYLAIKLPLHPFDYLYNFTIGRILGIRIPGRGSELQVNSIIAIVFNLTVIIFIILNIQINYWILALIYTLSSLYFISLILFKK